MAIPKKTKYRFRHLIVYKKGSKNNCRYLSAKGNKELTWGKYGLQTQEGAEISERQIEAMRKRISWFTRKFGGKKSKPWKFNIYPHNQKTKKPLEVRMGSGKGSVEKWVGIAKKKMVIVEISDKVPKEIAQKALNQASYKIKPECKFIEK